MKKFYPDKLEESTLTRFKRIVSGANSSWARLAMEETIMAFLMPVPGLVGVGLRRVFYPLLLNAYGAGTAIDRAVTLRCPSMIDLGKGCILESYVHLLAGSSQKPSIVLGDGSYVRSYSMLSSGPPDGFIHIGKKSTIGHQCMLHGHGGITIGDNVMLAGHTVLVASMHVHEDLEVPIIDQGFTAEGITIEDNVWIGMGVKVLDGVTIGSGTIVAAGSVVTSDLPRNAVVAGVPAQIKKYRS